jgi:NodT family efflux transporter outer membrane factor (OMF) lipoprotein
MSKKWLMTAALFSLSACASVNATAELTQDLRMTAPAGWQSLSGEDRARATDWLADFNDADLSALVSEALVHNHNLLASAERIAQAKALAVSGSAARLPSVNLSTNATRNLIQNVPDTKSYGASLSVSWEADLWGRIADRAKAGYASADAASADYEAARLSIAGQTVQAWFDLVEGAQQVALAQDDLQTRQRSSRLVERRYGRGVSSSLDVRLARSALAGSEATLALREQLVANAGRRLELLLGRYPANAIKAALSLPELAPLSGVGTPEGVLTRRPDIMAAEARLTAAGLRASEARKALLPRLSFSPSASTGGTKISDIFDLDTLAGRLFGNLAQPLFQGGALKAEVKRTRAAQREQIEAYASLVLRAWREAEDALDGEMYLARREAALMVSTTEAQEAEKLAIREYGRGVGTIFEMLDAQRRRISAQSQLIAASKERAANRVRLHLAIAGDFNTQVVKTAAFVNEDTSL